MQQISWKCLAVISIAMCSLVMAVPVPQNEETSFQNPSLDPANQGLISVSKENQIYINREYP